MFFATQNEIFPLLIIESKFTFNAMLAADTALGEVARVNLLWAYNFTPRCRYIHARKRSANSSSYPGRIKQANYTYFVCMCSKVRKFTDLIRCQQINPSLMAANRRPHLHWISVNQRLIIDTFNNENRFYWQKNNIFFHERRHQLPGN